MADHFVADVEEQLVLEAPAPKPLRVRIARYVSNILAPSSISLPFVVLVALYHARNLLATLAYSSVTLFFLSFGPLIYILIGVRLGKLSDFDVSQRSQRAGPFLFGIVSIVVGLLALSAIHGPRTLETVLLITAISGVILMIITLWWKISIHASSLAGVATMLTALYGTVMLPAFFLLVMVSWSRVVLHRHTVVQVVAGSLLGITLSTVILIIRGGV